MVGRFLPIDRVSEYRAILSFFVCAVFCTGCRNAPTPFDPFLSGQNRIPPPGTATSGVIAPPGYPVGAPLNSGASNAPAWNGGANPSVFGAPPPNNSVFNNAPPPGATSNAPQSSVTGWGAANPNSGSWVGGGAAALPSEHGYHSPNSFDITAAMPPRASRSNPAAATASNSGGGFWNWLSGGSRTPSAANTQAPAWNGQSYPQPNGYAAQPNGAALQGPTQPLSGPSPNGLTTNPFATVQTNSAAPQNANRNLPASWPNGTSGPNTSSAWTNPATNAAPYATYNGTDPRLAANTPRVTPSRTDGFAPSATAAANPPRTMPVGASSAGSATTTSNGGRIMLPELGDLPRPARIR